MSDLRAIVYVSTATWLMSDTELESLLVEARELNLESVVTGVLLYNDGSFMQYFEGSEESVRVTYKRIRDSRRHKNIIELLNEEISERCFPDWQMGFAQPTRSELLTMSTACWQRGEGAGGVLVASPGLGLLNGFWKRARR